MEHCMAFAAGGSGASLSHLGAQILHAQVPFRWRCLKVALDTCAFSGAQILHAQVSLRRRCLKVALDTCVFSGAQILHAQVSLRGGFALLNGSHGTWATPMRAAFSALSAFTLPSALMILWYAACGAYFYFGNEAFGRAPLSGRLIASTHVSGTLILRLLLLCLQWHCMMRT
jgi:hypothetical protein